MLLSLTSSGRSNAGMCKAYAFLELSWHRHLGSVRKAMKQLHAEASATISMLCLGVRGVQMDES